MTCSADDSCLSMYVLVFELGCEVNSARIFRNPLSERIPSTCIERYERNCSHVGSDQINDRENTILAIPSSKVQRAAKYKTVLGSYFEVS